jgi:hypothetical protein
MKRIVMLPLLRENISNTQTWQTADAIIIANNLPGSCYENAIILNIFILFPYNKWT